jgi:hypothetical protein
MFPVFMEALKEEIDMEILAMAIESFTEVINSFHFIV